MKDWDYGSAAMMALVAAGLVPGAILAAVNKKAVGSVELAQRALKRKKRPMLLDFEGLSVDPSQVPPGPWPHRLSGSAHAGA